MRPIGCVTSKTNERFTKTHSVLMQEPCNIVKNMNPHNKGVFCYFSLIRNIVL